MDTTSGCTHRTGSCPWSPAVAETRHQTSQWGRRHSRRIQGSSARTIARETRAVGIVIREAKHSVPADAISSVGPPLSHVRAGRKFDFNLLVVLPVVSQLHPASLEFFRCEADAIVRHFDQAALMSGNINVDSRCVGVPGVSYEFRQSIFGIADNVSQAPDEVIILEQ